MMHAISRLLLPAAFCLVLALRLPAAPATQSADQDPVARFDAKHTGHCGPICGYLACKYFGRAMSLDQMVSICGTTTEQGTSLLALRDALRAAGLYAEGRKMSPDELLANRRYFCILPVREWSNTIDHFLVVMGSKDSRVVLVNFPQQPVLFPISDLVKYWSGEVLLISDTPIGLLPGASAGDGGPIGQMSIARFSMLVIGVLALTFINTALVVRRRGTNRDVHSRE